MEGFRIGDALKNIVTIGGVVTQLAALIQQLLESTKSQGARVDTIEQRVAQIEADLRGAADTGKELQKIADTLQPPTPPATQG